MKYSLELSFITKEIAYAFKTYTTHKPNSIIQKTSFDLVTEIDKNIEVYLIEQIHIMFPNDHIHAEETSNDTAITERTWTIDPVDGTCNMAHGLKLYGVQCSLFENDEIVLSAIYLPWHEEMITAVKGEGCYLNGNRVFINPDVEINNAIVSFGDYPHKVTTRIADWQHHAIRQLYSEVAKIRMFGAACIDFSSVALGRIDGTVVITTNLWDIAPGILLCKEAGAIITNLNGEPYVRGSEGIIVTASQCLSERIVDAFSRNRAINRFMPQKKYDAVIFDFDGVILDTEKYHFMAWNKAFSQYGVSITQEMYAPLKSTGRNHIITTICDQFNLSLNEEEKTNIQTIKGEYYSELVKALSEEDIIPGVREYINYLWDNRIKLAIASSSEFVKPLLQEFNLLQYFDIIIDGTNHIRKKPYPDIFILAAKELDVTPEFGLVYEDSIPGIEAASIGGFDVIGVGLIHSTKAVATIPDFKMQH